VAVLDLSLAIGGPKLADVGRAFVVITEYNRSVQGFLVSGVERIINLSWGEIHPPPSGTGKQNYLTAVAEHDGELIEIIDVEKILSEITPQSTEVDAAIIEAQGKAPHDRIILIADDSTVARNQVRKTVEQLGLRTHVVRDGKEALTYLQKLADDGLNVAYEVLLVISDIEMPEMDGYTFTAAVRADPRLAELPIILHTSLSGVFNRAMVDKVGADRFIAKFDPNELAMAIQEVIAQADGQNH
jgi:two-component system chemotaxis response regulator CheV